MRPGYFEPGTAINFCAADCAEIGGGCCAKTAPPAQIAATVVATAIGL
jgi:hypothetical protein